METAQKILEQSRAIVSTARKTCEERLKAPEITQWEGVNFELHQEQFPLLKLPTNLKIVRTQAAELAKLILTEIANLENEIGNLETDIQHQTNSVENVTARATGIASGCDALENTLQEFVTQTDSLLQADAHLRSLLNMEGLLPIARAVMGNKSSLIDEGFQVFCAFADDTCNQCGGEKLANYSAKAVVLQEKINAIEFAGLPGMAANIIEHQRGIAKTAADQIKEYVEKTGKAMASEFKLLEGMKVEIAALRNDPAEKVIASISGAAKSLGSTMVSFRTHSSVLEKLTLIQALLQSLQLFQQTMESDVPATLKDSILDKSSPLNPAKLAQQRATEYFMGLQGVIRMVKLLLKNLAGGASLNETVLTQIIEQSITSCTIYFSNKPSAVKQMEKFIDSHLGGYQRPFPHDGLFQLIRRTLGDYGESLENFFATYPVRYNKKAAESPDVKGGSTTIGKLLDKMEIRTENLKSP